MRRRQKAKEQLIVVGVGTLGAAVTIFLAWGLGII